MWRIPPKQSAEFIDHVYVRNGTASLFKESLCRQIEQWQERRNKATATIQWQFSTDDARIKLRSLYPVTSAMTDH